MDPRPLFVILPGITADAERFESAQALARQRWPQADVRMPAYLHRFRGVSGTGAWLDRWIQAPDLQGRPIHLLAYILGGAALVHAPRFSAQVKRAVLVRSRYQEAVPWLLRRRFGPLAIPLFGKALWDLGGQPVWPAPGEVSWPQWTLLEGRPSALARRLNAPAFDDARLKLKAYEELPLDHDLAYHSGRLMDKSVEFLKA